MKHITLKLTPKEASAIFTLFTIGQEGICHLIDPMPDSLTLKRIEKKFHEATRWDDDAYEWRSKDA